MQPVYCSGCGIRIGVAPTKVRNAVFHSEWCAMQPKVSREEGRDSLVRAMGVDGYTLKEIAEHTGITRSRAWQVITEYDG